MARRPLLAVPLARRMTVKVAPKSWNYGQTKILMFRARENTKIKKQQ